MVPTSPSSNWQARRLGRAASLDKIKIKTKGKKVQWFPPSSRAEPRESPFWVAIVLEFCPPGSAAIGVVQGRDLWQGEPAVLPAPIQITALCVEGSSPSWLCKGDTARKGDVPQRVEMHKEPGGCQAGELCAATPQLPGHSPHSPLCLFQLSRGCGPILAQVLLDILRLVSPPCASLFWPLQHNVISSLGAAQL